MYAGIGITRRVEGAASESRRAGTGRQTVKRKRADGSTRAYVCIHVRTYVCVCTWRREGPPNCRQETVDGRG